jgi:hypothetical protein
MTSSGARLRPAVHAASNSSAPPRLLDCPVVALLVVRIEPELDRLAHNLDSREQPRSLLALPLRRQQSTERLEGVESVHGLTDARGDLECLAERDSRPLVLVQLESRRSDEIEHARDHLVELERPGQLEALVEVAPGAFEIVLVGRDHSEVRDRRDEPVRVGLPAGDPPALREAVARAAVLAEIKQRCTERVQQVDRLDVVSAGPSHLEPFARRNADTSSCRLGERRCWRGRTTLSP